MTATTRRALAFLLTFFVLSMNSSLHLGLDASAQGILASFVAGYIGQSTFKELKKQAQPTSKQLALELDGDA